MHVSECAVLREVASSCGRQRNQMRCWVGACAGKPAQSRACGSCTYACDTGVLLLEAPRVSRMARQVARVGATPFLSRPQAGVGPLRLPEQCVSGLVPS